MSDYGFIITRHVNSNITNEYWNQSVKLIRTYYPFAQIIIIDDNSNNKYLKSHFNYSNLTIIQSEYHQRGELLPFIYYLKYRWFSSAIIIHDSLFIHKKINFEKFMMPVLPLWHHSYDKENIANLIRITSSLNNNHHIINKLNKNDETRFNFVEPTYNLCFGCQCYIKLQFLDFLENKYKISNLTNVIQNRKDRCGLERIFGLLFCYEYPKLIYIKSLFGDIVKKYKAFNYNYNNYENDLKNKILIHPFIKVWTGR